jgi:hypothetical protein
MNVRCSPLVKCARKADMLAAPVNLHVGGRPWTSSYLVNGHARCRFLDFLFLPFTNVAGTGPEGPSAGDGQLLGVLPCAKRLLACPSLAEKTPEPDEGEESVCCDFGQLLKPVLAAMRRDAAWQESKVSSGPASCLSVRKVSAMPRIVAFLGLHKHQSSA